MTQTANLDIADPAALLRHCTELEQRLQAAEAMLEGTMPGILLYDAQHRLVHANTRAATICGLSPGSLRPGLTRTEVLQLLATNGELGPPEEAERFISGRLQVFANQFAASPRAPIRHLRHRPNGAVLEILTNPTPEGGVVVTLIDATARFQAEQIADERAAILNAVMDNVRIGVSVFGPDRRMRAQNRMAREISGRPPGMAAIGRELDDIVRDIAEMGGHAADPAFRGVTDAALAADRSKPFQYTRPGFDGGWVDIYSDPTPDGGFTITHVDVTELRQARESELQHAALHRTMLETMGQGITIYDRDHRLLAFNKLAAEINCCTGEDFRPGVHMGDLIETVLARGGFGPGAAGTLAAAESLSLDRSKPASSRRINARGRVVMANSTPTQEGGFVVTYTDITRLVEAEQAERHRAELLHTTLDSIQHGIMVFGPDGRLRLANRRALFGECEGTRAGEQMPSYADMVRDCLVRGVFGTGWPADSLAEYFAEMDHSRPRQEILSLPAGRQVELFSIPTADGGFVIAHTDVTELVDARNASNTAAQELRALIDAMPGVLIRQRRHSDRVWTRFYVSDSVRDMTGYTPAEAFARGWWADNTDPADLPELFEKLDLAFAGGQSSAEFRFRCKNGAWIWVRVIMRGNIDPSGQAEAICVWSDITRERELDEQIAYAKRLAQMGEVATGMAHEMNQPLASISMAAENALRALGNLPASTKQLSDKLRLITDQAHRAAALTDHIRVFSRSGQERIGPVRLQDAVGNAAALLDGTLKSNLVRLENRLPKAFPEVTGRLGALEQALVNLIANACDAYATRQDTLPPVERVIRVDGHAEAAAVHMRVRDFAGGIREDLLPRVFEPFFTTKPVGQGAGLGLSMAYGIVADLGGSISVRNVEDGTEFQITLPRAFT
jgi:PAS domain S-box-containing protein